MRQLQGQLPLVARFQRELPNLVHQQVLLCVFQNRRRTAPLGLQGAEGLKMGCLLLAFQQNNPPRQSDGQQLSQMWVCAALQASLPAQIGAPGSPAVDGEQHRLEIVGPNRLRQPQTLQYPAFCFLPRGR